MNDEGMNIWESDCKVCGLIFSGTGDTCPECEDEEPDPFEGEA